MLRSNLINEVNCPIAGDMGPVNPEALKFNSTTCFAEQVTPSHCIHGSEPIHVGNKRPHEDANRKSASASGVAEHEGKLQNSATETITDHNLHVQIPDRLVLEARSLSPMSNALPPPIVDEMQALIYPLIPSRAFSKKHSHARVLRLTQTSMVDSLSM